MAPLVASPITVPTAATAFFTLSEAPMKTDWQKAIEVSRSSKGIRDEKSGRSDSQFRSSLAAVASMTWVRTTI